MKKLLRLIGTRQWLRLGIRRRIVGAFYPVGRSSASGFTVPYHGIRYRGDISIAQEWHVYFFGGYELKEAALMEDILREMKGAVALDVGANLGGHALVMASCASEVHAFEPFIPLADRIKEHIASNAITNINLHCFGLGEADEKKAYYFDNESCNSGTGSFIAEHSEAAAVGELPVVRGDRWAGKRRLDFVKIDVEGYEALVLKGLEESLAANKPIIMMEVTESSWKIFEARGGISRILSYPIEIFEICNPPSFLGVFQRGRYRLERRSLIEPRGASYNVLIVASERRIVVEGLNGSRA